ncbi:MAG: UvrD-helicase domain-containing protein [Bacteroidota bacterium]|nr:UvrD-helicase domain-containing protein [Bacteroidota bacterium]
MSLCLVIIIGIVVVIAVIGGIVVIRIRIKNKSKHFVEKINNISTYSEKNYSEQIQELSQQNDNAFVGIAIDIDKSFCDEIISTRQKNDFMCLYAPYFNEAKSLVKKLQIFNITPNPTILNLIEGFENIDLFVKKHNEEVINLLLATHKDFFDHCLKYPLDDQQRRSIVAGEDNCLVVSSAGSGKTSSIVGKVKYLTEIKGISPERILLISYTHKAALELTERVATKGLRGYTFHKLAIDIIGKTTGRKPSICENTDALFINIYHKLLKNTEFRKSVLKYFVDYPSEVMEWKQRKEERQKQLSEQKRTQLKALFPDMDDNVIYVKSKQEQQICFVLYSFGVKFRYEEEYEHKVWDETHSQYRPDFSIYFEKNGEKKRIYLEHFGVDELSLVPVWFAEQKNITYQEANKKYNDGITWKKEVHEKYGTQLLTTSSADFNSSNIKDKLKQLLQEAGVPIEEKTDEELYNSLLPPSSKKEKAFIRLVVTFVSLLKSNCKYINEVLQQAKDSKDKRSIFIIKNIFKPVYEQYIKELRDKEQIDFTDAIIQATEICHISHPVEYDYIIVDEFQDISIDRYNFLKALREGNPPAKLYCVGDDWQSIYRFSGSDMSLFNQFPEYFGATEINKIETTYRFGEPLVSLSSQFIQKNKAQIQKNIHSFSSETKTELEFCAYDRINYCNTIGQLVSSIPADKSIFLLGRYSFDDYYLSFMYSSVMEGNRFYYMIGGRKIEFLTVHKSKGLEADYVILLLCNNDTHGFPSLISDDTVLNYVLTKSDKFPFSEERRLFYVAITRAKIKTFVLYDKRFPSVFVKEFLHSEDPFKEPFVKHRNANKIWTKGADRFLLQLYKEGKSIKYISNKMGRSQTSILMRLNKLNQ